MVPHTTSGSRSRMASDKHRTARVAVIGAGPAGLAVAHELLKEGHTVTVFEASSSVGGAWHFDSSTDSDLSAQDPNRIKVHSSMYQGLRTNLPRPVMSFLDFPFIPEAMRGKSHDPRMYPLHTEVLAYYQEFAETFGLLRHIQFNTTVGRIDPVAAPARGVNMVTNNAPAAALRINNGGVNSLHNRSCVQSAHQWRVTTAPNNSHTTVVVSATHSNAQTDASEQRHQLQHEHVFDAVASCAGIFSEPNLPQVEGMSDWPGLQLHSHNYRSPGMFKHKTVVVVGASFSGEEIARVIASVAENVYHSARTFTGPGTAREPTGSACEAPQQQQQQPHVQQLQHICSPLCDASTVPAQQQRGLCECQSPQKLQTTVCSAIQPNAIPAAPQPKPNIHRVAMLQQLLHDGSVMLTNGQVLHNIDAIVYCTGYKHTYPWMDHLNIVDTSDGHVRPLYLHMFPPGYAPSLALIGLPWRCAKIPQVQLQGQLLARLLSGRAALPSVQHMLQEHQLLFDTLKSHGIPRRYTHCMADFMPEHQWMYADKLIKAAVAITAADASNPDSCRQQQQQDRQQLQQAGVLVIPEWLKAVADAIGGDILSRPDTFRESWSEAAELAMQQAHEDMLLLLGKMMGC